MIKVSCKDYQTNHSMLLLWYYRSWWYLRWNNVLMQCSNKSTTALSFFQSSFVHLMPCLLFSSPLISGSLQLIFFLGGNASCRNGMCGILVTSCVFLNMKAGATVIQPHCASIQYVHILHMWRRALYYAYATCTFFFMWIYGTEF